MLCYTILYTVCPKYEDLPSISMRFKKKPVPGASPTAEAAEPVTGLVLYQAVDARYFDERGLTLHLFPEWADGSGHDFSVELWRRCPVYNGDRDLDDEQLEDDILQDGYRSDGRNPPMVRPCQPHEDFLRDFDTSK